MIDYELALNLRMKLKIILNLKIIVKDRILTSVSHNWPNLKLN